MTRARAVERKRNKEVATVIVDRVPCAFGGEEGHPITIHLDAEGKVLRLDSPCTLHPPTAEETAVMRSLVGAHEVTSCLDHIAVLRKALTEHSLYSYQISRELDSKPLASIVEQIAEYAKEQHKPRRGVKPSKSIEKMGRILNLENLARKYESELSLPVDWRLAFRIRDKGRRITRDIPMSLDRRGERLTVGIRHKHSGETHYVAEYVGRGRFKFMTGGINTLANAGSHFHAPRGTDGKVACTVCRKRVTTMSQHVKTAKHKKNTEDAVFQLCEHIGSRLKHRHWRSR